MIELIYSPFAEFSFMKKGLAALICLAFSSPPLGVFLVLRRMSLLGDTLSHAVLPGVALSYLLFGLSLPALLLGGLVAGLLIALVASFITRHSHIHEDSSFAAFYVIALALGVIIVSKSGTSTDLLHFLFGNILSISNESLILIAAGSSLSLILATVFFRHLLLEFSDPVFYKNLGKNSSFVHGLFYTLLVSNLVLSFQALGSLMAIGLLLLPAIIARLLSQDISKMIFISWGVALASCISGTVMSFWLNLPTGPSVIMVLAGKYALALAFNTESGLLYKIIKRPHRVR